MNYSAVLKTKDSKGIFHSVKEKKSCDMHLCVSIVTGPSILYFVAWSQKAMWISYTQSFYKRYCNCFSNSLFKA